MTGRDLQRLRQKLGMSSYELGRALGYTGTRATIMRTIRRYEQMAELPAVVVDRVKAKIIGRE